MAKKNNLAKEKKQRKIDLQGKKKELRPHAKGRVMIKVDDGAGKKIVKRGFKLGNKKKVKVKFDLTEVRRIQMQEAYNLFLECFRPL